MNKRETETKTKGMCIATRCTSVDQFVQMFHRFVDEHSFFISTLNTRPPGLETSFSVQLADGTPVLRGLCVVQQAWTTSANQFKSPGVRLGIKRLTAQSTPVFERLLASRNAAKKPPAPPSLASVVIPKPGTPRPIAKSPFTETAPAVSAPSRLELKGPARPASEPAEQTLVVPERASTGDAIPRAVTVETTDMMEEKTDVRPTKLPTPAMSIPSIPSSSPSPSPSPSPSRSPSPSSSSSSSSSSPPAPSPGATLAAKLAAMPIQPVETPTKPLDIKEVAKPLAPAEPVPDDARTPGSELVLPANPLMNLSDESLEGYVDCTLYEETADFFPAEDDTSFPDDVVPPPEPSDGAPGPSPVDEAALARGSAPVLPMPEPRPPAGDTPAMAAESASGSPKLPLAPPAYDSAPVLAAAVLAAPVAVAVPAGPVDAAPVPSTASASPVLVPTRRKRPSWWVIGGGAGALAFGVLGIVMATSSSDGARAPAPAPARPAAAAAVAQTPESEPPVAPRPAEPAHPDEEPDEQPDESTAGKPPVVGSGPCQVIVHSTPAGSMVKLDGASVGPSPLTIAASCGRHKVEVVHPRYALGAKQVTLAEGKPETLELTLSRPTHAVTVTSNPSGAQVFIDGRQAGTTPTKLNVLGFVTLKLEFKKTGYQPTSTKLYSKRSQDKVAVRLQRW